jgi:hypothetical protein
MILQRCVAAAMMITLATACGLPPGPDQPYPEDATGLPAQPAPTLAVTAGTFDVKTIDVCAGIPADEVVKVVGRNVVKPPEFFSWAGVDVGCFYDAGRDDWIGKKFYAYIIIGPPWLYEINRVEGIRMQQADGLGDEAFAFKGPDAEQLWVLLNGRAAIMVAIGDRANLTGARQLAALAAALVP